MKASLSFALAAGCLYLLTTTSGFDRLPDLPRASDPGMVSAETSISPPQSARFVDRYRIALQNLPDESLFGDRHSLGRAAGNDLQRAIDRRLNHGEAEESPDQVRILYHMTLLRECQLEELAWRRYQRNRFGHTFDRPSGILGEGFSSRYDEPLRKVRSQRSQLETTLPL